MKTEYTHVNKCNCGCKGGLGNSTGFISNPCGCGQGLGESPTEDSTETQKDLITEAKKYINGEIPTKVKVAAGIGVIGLLLLAKKRRR
ncbi:hypothetical protein SAMN05443144_12720 [Fodinibius roseus]|uniref:Uncharacterized protein n=1 Tax=Fodinibius roseus TaxID=1194090 RepID=A0A1M5JIY8_9BACT|nr:hypothetical protein [Fodinibius roseus]SHG40240.1 hypothetical protein SAMN05443144_12720 [Fodinibius roseus]